MTIWKLHDIEEEYKLSFNTYFGATRKNNNE